MGEGGFENVMEMFNIVKFMKKGKIFEGGKGGRLKQVQKNRLLLEKNK